MVSYCLFVSCHWPGMTNMSSWCPLHPTLHQKLIDFQNKSLTLLKGLSISDELCLKQFKGLPFLLEKRIMLVYVFSCICLVSNTKAATCFKPGHLQSTAIVDPWTGNSYDAVIKVIIIHTSYCSTWEMFDLVWGILVTDFFLCWNAVLYNVSLVFLLF